MEHNEKEDGVGTVVQTDDEAQWRMCVKSDGKFASKTFFLVVNDSADFHLDSIEPKLSPKEAIPGLISTLKSNHGEGLFYRMADRNLMDEKESVNSAKGYCSRYLHTHHSWKNRNSVRRGEKYFSDVVEAGSFVPVKVKVVALPPDEDADKCSSWEEYELLSQSRGTAPKMSRREFEIYKY